MKVVEEEALRVLVREAEALGAVENAFLAVAEGRVVQPPPLGMDLVEVKGEVHVKGAYLKGEPVFAMKVATGFYNNARVGLPTGSGLVLVFHAETGVPLALLRDNGYLTELRTGGAGALAVRLLAPERTLSVGVIGAGSQARYQLRAMQRVRTLGAVRVWSPIPEEVERYIREMTPVLQAPIRGAPSPEMAVDGADLVVTVTPSRKPLIHRDCLTPGVTVVAVGSDGPEKRELAGDILGWAEKVVVDSREQCLRLGEVHHAVSEGILTPDDIHGELGEVLTGSIPGREGEEAIVADLTGLGAQDAAMASMVWRRGQER